MINTKTFGRITHYALLVTFFVFTFSFPVLADSLFKADKTTSPYSPDKSFKVGDIITIIVLENTTARNKAGTQTDVKDDFGSQFTHTIANLNPLIGPNNQINGQLSQKYGGAGTTQRESNVQAKVAAQVVDVLNNGNLKIEGKHRVAVNDENQDILVSGIVRSKDVSISNTIFSSQIAEANISIKGSGSVQEAEAPGWFTRLLNWLF